METERRILFNTFSLSTGHGVAQLANLAFVVYFARAFGAGTLGEYSFAMAIGAMISIFASFGTIALATKQISRTPETEGQLLGALIPMQALAGSIAVIGIVALGQALQVGPTAYGMLVIIALYQVILRWNGLLSARFNARESMAYVASADAIQNVARLLFGATGIWLFREPLIAIGAFPICAFATLAWLYSASTRRFGRVSLSLSIHTAKALILEAWPYFSILILNVLYARLGIVLLASIQSEAAVGYFASAERLVASAGLLYSMFLGAIFPAMTRLAAHDRVAMEKLAERCLRLLLVVTLPAATLLHLLSSDIVRLLYGTGFEHSVAVLKIVSWALVLQGLSGYFSVLAMANNLQNELSKIRFASLVMLIALAVPLVYSWSYMGLAYAIVGADAFLVAIMYGRLRHRIAGIRLVNAVWRTGFACVILLVVQVFLSNQSFTIRIMTFPAILIGVMILVGAVKSHDLNFLRKIAISNPKN